MPDARQSSSAPTDLTTVEWGEYLDSVVAERDRLRALLKQAHDRDKWEGEFPTIKWYDDVARYFQGKCP